VYATCFISYAAADISFANKLFRDLTKHNVTCWLDKSELRGGESWEEQIGRAIDQNEKLILICSQRSVYRPNVVKEIMRALDAERTTGTQKLFPIRIDNHVLSTQMMDEAREKVRSGEWRENWVFYVQRYHIPDFNAWNNPSLYEAELTKLLDGLQHPQRRGRV
jgi:hypothetical protein